MNKPRESKAMLEVWKWKEEAWNEVKHLDQKAAIHKRITDSIKTTKRLFGSRLVPARTKRNQ